MDIEQLRRENEQLRLIVEFLEALAKMMRDQKLRNEGCAIVEGVR